jgi:hypothetical protein
LEGIYEPTSQIPLTAGNGGGGVRRFAEGIKIVEGRLLVDG